MRICSLVPAATEILFALGLGDSVVGVSHECDWPSEAPTRTVVTASLIDSEDLSSAEVDQAISEGSREGRPLYAIDATRWAEIEADVVVAQELCHVCAVSIDDAQDLVAAQAISAEIIDVSPGTFGEILQTIEALGSRLGRQSEAVELVADARRRVERVQSAVRGVESSPRVFVSEWLEPPYAAGHWVPDMVELAGGTDLAGMSGAPSHRMRWTDVAALQPDVVVLAPCGFDLDRTLSEVVTLDLSAHLLGTPAREESMVFAVDANGLFSRPGPRVIEGIELLAYLLHPSACADPGLPWSRIRL